MTIPSTDRSRWKAQKKKAEAIREILVERFPRCFCPKGAPKRPLKIGIDKDLRKAMPEFGRRPLRLAIADYTSGRTYKRQMIAGAYRVDLDGFPAGVVTEIEADVARAKLARADQHAAERSASAARRRSIQVEGGI